MSGITLGVVRGISYGLFGEPDRFVPAARGLGAGLVRAYLYWAQVEPRPGERDWGAVDALLDQLDGDEQLWVTVCSSSPWGTRVATDFQPPSPALDDAAYSAFVTALVRRCRGRVRYWQCNNEPSNTGLLWAGTADEYVHQLELMAAAVRAVDPAAQVVLGGCGYDVLSSPDGSPQREFFEVLARAGRDHFDVFDLHLYDDPYAIPGHVAGVRALMHRHGYERPVAVGEYGGPTLFEFPAATRELGSVMAAAMAGPVEMSRADLAAQIAQESPDRRALRALYERADDAPPELRMFMADAPAGLVARRDRLAGRQLVQRALTALVTGIDTLVCWNLAPEVAGYTDRYNIMELMFGTLALMDFRGGEISEPRPTGRAHRLLAAALAGADRVEPVAVDAEDVVGYRIHRADHPARLVLWARRADPLDESGPAVPVSVGWPHPRAHVVDVHGVEGKADVDGATARLDVSHTPIFVTADGLPALASRP
jgi:hypothetical protein